MPRVIGYAYDAAIHCPNCTRFYDFELCHDKDCIDENKIPIEGIDSEGNKLGVVFSTDENAHREWCNDCGAPLFE